jgi:hypothetical protein
LFADLPVFRATRSFGSEVPIELKAVTTWGSQLGSPIHLPTRAIVNAGLAAGDLALSNPTELTNLGQIAEPGVGPAACGI